MEKRSRRRLVASSGTVSSSLIGPNDKLTYPGRHIQQTLHARPLHLGPAQHRRRVRQHHLSPLDSYLSHLLPFPYPPLPNKSHQKLISPASDVPGDSDITNESTGLNRKHPKVYVGFFSHASFPEINKSRKTIFNGACPKERDLLGNEYRSNDWWRMPRAENIRP
ncbi:MAG: hypothetical protein L6R36_008952, partial [Xanthoria steineri]